MPEPRTKTGYQMNPAIRTRLVEALTDPDHDGATQAQIAAAVGIAVRTLRNYLTPDLWEEVRQLRLEVMYRSLSLVDRAVFAKAMGGDIAAAKLIYSRWDAVRSQLPTTENITTEAELDAAITTLQERINHLEHVTLSPEMAVPPTPAPQIDPPAPEPDSALSTPSETAAVSPPGADHA